MSKLDGSKWRLRKTHPRRPEMPLQVSDKAGRQIGKPGDTCDGIPRDVLASLIHNDYVEPVGDLGAESPKPARKKSSAKRKEN